MDISRGGLHHVAVSVFGADFALFMDGQLQFSQSLIAVLEDGPGVLFIGRKLGEDRRLEGKKFSTKYSMRTVKHWIGDTNSCCMIAITLTSCAIIYFQVNFLPCFTTTQLYRM